MAIARNKFDAVIIGAGGAGGNNQSVGSTTAGTAGAAGTGGAAGGGGGAAGIEDNTPTFQFYGSIPSGFGGGTGIKELGRVGQVALAALTTPALEETERAGQAARLGQL